MSGVHDNHIWSQADEEAFLYYHLPMMFSDCKSQYLQSDYKPASEIGLTLAMVAERYLETLDKRVERWRDFNMSRLTTIARYLQKKSPRCRMIKNVNLEKLLRRQGGKRMGPVAIYRGPIPFYENLTEIEFIIWHWYKKKPTICLKGSELSIALQKLK